MPQQKILIRYLTDSLQTRPLIGPLTKKPNNCMSKKQDIGSIQTPNLIELQDHVESGSETSAIELDEVFDGYRTKAKLINGKLTVISKEKVTWLPNH